LLEFFHTTIVSHTNTSIRHLSSNSFPQLFKEGLATIVRLKKLKKFQQVGSTAFLFVLVQCLTWISCYLFYWRRQYDTDL